MNAVDGILFGFSVAFEWRNLLACFIGVLIGTVVGVLPGIGPVGAMALLLPVTYALTPAGALIMLAGIYYGSMYGGSTTAILLKVPGEVSSVVTTLDGYEMARRGRAGPALFVAAIGSFVAGTVGVVGLAFIGPLLSKVALTFGPPEYFALCLLGLMVLSRLTGSSLSRAFVMVAAGLALSTVGMEPMSGTSRTRLPLGPTALEMGLWQALSTSVNSRTASSTGRAPLRSPTGPSTGIYTLANGNKYVGEFRDDKYTGQGTYSFANGKKYVGEFRDDKLNGQGTQTFANGNPYVGEFKDDNYNGQGTFTGSNGEKYVSEFKDGGRNGQGVLYRSDGSSQQSGAWENGVFVR